MSSDRRLGHYLQAEALLRNASNLSHGRPNLDTVDFTYWLYVAEAQVHATLANAPTEVVTQIAWHEVERERERVESIREADEFIDTFMSRKAGK